MIAIFNFIAVTVTFALAAILDVVTDESSPGVIPAFLLEAAVIISLPVFNYRQEKKMRAEVTAKRYNALYFSGYFLAMTAAMTFISKVDVRKFFPESDSFVWLDLRGIGVIFLAYGIVGGFVWALIYRGIVWLINYIKK